MSEREPHDLDREVEDLERQGDKVQDDIDETRKDWESKQDDPSVPGAVAEGHDPLGEETPRRSRLGRMAGLHKGDGWAVAHLHDLGEGPGFLKIRRELDVAEMGVNAIVLPAGAETGFHFHERQEEVYFVHRGTIEMEFGDGTTHELSEGGLARVDAATHRKIRTVGDTDALYVIFGAQGGYVGRDGQVPEGETRVH